MRAVMLEVPADLLRERARTGADRSDETWEGAAALVVEIRAPGDETLEKLPFYERVGVQEVLVVDRDIKAVRQWVRVGGRLEERSAPADGRRTLTAVPRTVRQAGDHLEVATAAGTAVI